MLKELNDYFIIINGSLNVLLTHVSVEQRRKTEAGACSRPRCVVRGECSPVVSKFTDNIYEKVKNKTKQDLKEKWVSLYKMLCAAKVNVSPHPCDDILTTKASGRLTNVPGFSPSSPKDAVSNNSLQWTLEGDGYGVWSKERMRNK